VTQTPAVQVGVLWLALHATSHRPQWSGLSWRLTSQPLVASVSQLPNPALHCPSWQCPPWQTAAAFEYEHAVPQAPQLAIEELGPEVCRFVSQPFRGMPSQSPQPEPHTGRHSPFIQLVETV